MATPPKVEIKRYRRFPGWDYSRGASLFITISTLPRRPLFGRIMAGKVELSPLGLIVRESLEQMPRLNPGILLFGYVVMPDHVHFNVHVDAGLQEPLKVLGKAVSRSKVYTTKQAKLMGLVGPGLLWQQGYHDRLCLTREFIDSTERYIAYNPLKWELMHGAVGGLRIQEPLNAPCLDLGDYWKGVGNTELLNGRIVSLRVSREVRTSDQIGAVVARMKNAVERGYVILSGYVSSGEKAVRDMPCATCCAHSRKLALFVFSLHAFPMRDSSPKAGMLEPSRREDISKLPRGMTRLNLGVLPAWITMPRLSRLPMQVLEGWRCIGGPMGYIGWA